MTTTGMQDQYLSGAFSPQSVFGLFFQNFDRRCVAELGGMPVVLHGVDSMPVLDVTDADPPGWRRWIGTHHHSVVFPLPFARTPSIRDPLDP